MAQNGAEGTFSAICVHYCVTTGRPRESRVATVYTNVPKRLRGTIFGDLCTLLRPHRPPARASRRNSVHKCPETAPRGRFRRSVYTIASPCIPTGRPRDPRAATVYTNAPERLRGTIFGDLCTLLRPTASPGGPRAATVYTNGPERRRKAVFGDLCTLLCPLRHHGAPAS